MTDRKRKAQLPLSKKLKFSSSSDNLKILKMAANKDDGKATAGSENNVPLSPESRSPEESVFSIDHILESILANCDRQTLLNSRLVSQRWAIYGSKELQKIVCIVFHKLELASGKPLLTKKKRSLEDLMTVMNNSSEFPCNSFEFANSIEGKTIMSTPQWFFTAYGFAIKKVKFKYIYIHDLKKFLLKQAPNLQQLHLGAQIRVKYSHSTKGVPKSETEEQQSERERFEESFFDITASKPKPILKNLKTFRCGFCADVPEILIQQILECSPNLVDVALPCYNLHLLVRPTNRVHLVKKLTVRMNSSNIESYKQFANHLQDNKDFALRELCYRTGENYDDDDEDNDDEEFHARVANVMEKILRASSATCRKLVWLQEDNLEIPRMPQLKHLTILLALKCNTDDDDIQTIGPNNSMREGVSLGDTFSSLKSLELRISTVIGNRPTANIFNGIDPLHAANVKAVTVRFWRPCQNVVRRLKKMFPNAAFRKKVPVYSDDNGDSDQESGSDETDNDESDYCQEIGHDKTEEEESDERP